MLVPDLTATHDVDPVVIAKERNLEFLGRVLEAIRREIAKEKDEGKLTDLRTAEKEQAGDIADLEAMEYEPDETTPVITLGYLPASKLTSIRHAGSSVHRMPAGLNKDEASTDLDREVCTWGVKGWRLQGAAGELEIGKVWTKCRGVEFSILDAESLDVIERMGWLQPLAYAVLEFNRLGADVKKK